MTGPARQRGVVLAVSLLLLAVLALLATVSINLGSNSLLVVSNEQDRRATAAAAEAVVEETISDISNFTAPVALDQVRDGMTVTGTPPVCVSAATVPGFSLTYPLALQHNYYRFRTSADDNASGARTGIHTGVRILLNAGTCGP